MSLFKFEIGDLVYIKEGTIDEGRTFTGSETGEVTRLGRMIDVKIGKKLYSFYESELESLEENSSNLLSKVATSIVDIPTFGIDLSRFFKGWP